MSNRDTRLAWSGPPAKKSKAFNPAHVYEFGLMVIEKDLITGVTVSVHCQFCVYFDREERNPELVRKCAKTTSVVNFLTVIRVLFE